MPTSPQILDEKAVREIEARYEKATPGPWERGTDIECQNEPDNCWHAFERQAEIFPPLGEAGPVAVASQCDFDNAGFITHAREDVPALCATVRALQTSNEAIGKSLKEFCAANAEAVDQVRILSVRLSEVEKERERLLKLYNEAWLWVQQRVRHPNTGQPPAAMTLIEMLPLLNQRVINLCKEKAARYKALADDSLPNDQTAARLAASARSLQELAIEIENFDHQEGESK